MLKLPWDCLNVLLKKTPVCLCRSVSFSHSQNITFLFYSPNFHNLLNNITTTPPPPSPLPNHHSLYLHHSIPNIPKPCPLQLTCYKHHTSIILLVRFSQIIPPFPLRQPIFHVTTRTQNCQSGQLSYCKPCFRAPR